MKRALSSTLTAYRRFKSAKASSKAYQLVRYLVVSSVAAYVLLLSFPQVIFAHEFSYRNLEVYSAEPLDQNIYAVLDKVESRLATSEINNQRIRPRIFITNSHRMYAFISIYLGGNSFGKGFAALPTNNIFINRSDIAKDLVFRKAVAK